MADFNFGMIEINRTADNDIVVTMSVKTLMNYTPLVKKLSLKEDLTANDDKKRFPRMCKTVHNSHQFTL